MSREELIRELTKRTGIDKSILLLKSTPELEDLYEERILNKGMF
ncbi:hypothetical protein [Lederbergia galactosidilytica]|nr:hypothetical protein [Lederbergia galactosidilytica]